MPILVQTVDFFRGIDDPATAGTLRVHFPRVLRVAGTEQYCMKKKRIKKKIPASSGRRECVQSIQRHRQLSGSRQSSDQLYTEYITLQSQGRCVRVYVCVCARAVVRDSRAREV